MTRLYAILAIISFVAGIPTALQAATATSSASSSSTGGVTITGSCSGNCTVSATASTTVNGITTTLHRSLLGTGSFSEHQAALAARDSRR